MADIIQEFVEAKKIVLAMEGPPTISAIQRGMRVGYNKAARLVEIMIDEGVLERDPKEPWMLRVS